MEQRDLSPILSKYININTNNRRGKIDSKELNENSEEQIKLNQEPRKEAY